jgi:enterochelin esterase-like enzyme
VRRLVLALMVLALAIIAGVASAGAAKSGPALKVTGSVHASGGKLSGSFSVKNEGATTSPALTAAIKLLGPKAKGKVPKLTVAHAKVPALGPGAKKRISINVAIPGSVKSGHWSVVVCAGGCTAIGGFAADGGQNQKKATAPNAPTAPVTPPTPPVPAAPQPLCPTPSAPITHSAEEPFRHAGCGVEYWGYVPSSYNPATPAPLLIWLHGCEGISGGDIYTVSPGLAEKPQDWISLTLIGREEPGNECWVPSVDETKVLQALTDVESHLNIDTHRVILGGYSSGGDLAYRTGFRHSSTFAGLLIENSAPFRDTESTEAESLAAATTKFHIVHLAHDNEDEVYDLNQTKSEVKAVENAGFPITLVVRPGEHYDANTDRDMQEVLLPYIDKGGWTSP